MLPVFDQLDTRDAGSVIRALRAGAEANLRAKCRAGSCDVIGPFVAGEGGSGEVARLIATGDIHDNPVHLARVVQAAGLGGDSAEGPMAHLTLHELIHSDRLENGVDLSYRVLARAAALKASHPELVHVLLANHELAQLIKAEVLKDGVRCVEAFAEGLALAFGDRAGEVAAAVDDFVRSMPIGLRVRMSGDEGSGGDLFCSHSLPSAELMDRFDPGVIERALTDEDYVPRRGSAHLMVWGRRQPSAMIEALASRWGVGLFVLGHEYAERGVMAVSDRAVVVNTDHAGGGYLDLDLRRGVDASAATGAFRRIAV